MKTAGIVAAAVLGGAVLGAGTVRLTEQRRGGDVAAVDEAVSVSAVRVVTNTVVRVVTNAVRVRVDDLELEDDEDLVAGVLGENDRLSAALAQKEAELDRIRKAEEAERLEREARRQSFQEREETMRREEPERYAEMQKRRDEFRQQMKEAVTDRTTFLTELDTSGMTEQEKASHDELLTRIESTWQIIESIQERGIPDRATRAKLMENYQALGKLYETERDYVLRQVGAGLGYNAQQAADFSAYIKEIYTLTSPSLPRGMGMRGRGDRGAPSRPPAQP